MLSRFCCRLGLNKSMRLCLLKMNNKYRVKQQIKNVPFRLLDTSGNVSFEVFFIKKTFEFFQCRRYLRKAKPTSLDVPPSPPPAACSTRFHTTSCPLTPLCFRSYLLRPDPGYHHRRHRHPHRPSCCSRPRLRHCRLFSAGSGSSRLVCAKRPNCQAQVD